jgi:hypothetical protein
MRGAKRALGALGAAHSVLAESAAAVLRVVLLALGAADSAAARGTAAIGALSAVLDACLLLTAKCVLDSSIAQR